MRRYGSPFGLVPFKVYYLKIKNKIQNFQFVATSNLSKMVPVISLGFCGLGLKNFKLNEKAINIKTKEVSTTYQVDNIHDPNVKVTFCNEGEQYFVKVTIMKE